MAIRKVILKENEQLRKVCRDVTNFDNKLHTLLDDMYDTMVSMDGVGIAAPQVAILRNVLIVQIDGKNKYEMVNPKLVSKDGQQSGLEGCLSCPDQWGIVTRSDIVTVDYFDRDGNKKTIKTEGFLARAILHEMDHLKGILFIDIVDKFLNEKELEDYMNKER
ncbi:MAG: peptide deformylase [Oscillospiraceae bacterium]